MDRLLIPFPPNPTERERWRNSKERWDPDLLEKRRAALGEQLVEWIPWDEEHQGVFRQALDAVREDSRHRAVFSTSYDDVQSCE
jgi:hypothetical protein